MLLQSQMILLKLDQLLVCQSLLAIVMTKNQLGGVFVRVRRFVAQEASIIVCVVQRHGCTLFFAFLLC